MDIYDFEKIIQRIYSDRQKKVMIERRLSEDIQTAKSFLESIGKRNISISDYSVQMIERYYNIVDRKLLDKLVDDGSVPREVIKREKKKILNISDRKRIRLDGGRFVQDDD